MDPVKAAFLQAVLNQGKDINQENFLPFFLAMQKNASERGITFTRQETDMIYEQMKNRLSPSDRKQLELLRMILQQNSGRSDSGPGSGRK
ncbi:MAG: hypothetical protein MR966_12905 [Lachnospiraceae bacterium]|nr:hypothetical protein [Lachnospiraceae bacterium]